MGIALAGAGIAAAFIPSREARRAAAAHIHPPHVVAAAPSVAVPERSA
jgi:hypothetical protein